jgi:hypothetical protein
MTRCSQLILPAALIVLMAVACKKSDNKGDNNSDSRTMTNIAGTYGLTALTANLGGASFNIYDTLPACEKDNLVILSASGDVHFQDAGVACTPPDDSTGTWSLSAKADSIYIGDQSGFIKSFDGTTIVLVSSEDFGGIPLQATTTFTKK